MKRLAILAVAVFAAALLARSLIVRETHQQRAENDRLRAALAELREQIRDIAEERDLIIGILVRRQIVDTIAKETPDAAAALAALSRIPRPIVLERVSLEGLQLRLEGRARTAGELDALRAALEGSAVFSRVGVAELRPGGAQNAVAFALAADLKPLRETGLEQVVAR